MTAKKDPEFQAKRAAALEAWQEAQKATKEARTNVREAESHLLNCLDAERRLWLALRDTEWENTYSKNGDWLSSRRVPIEPLLKTGEEA